MLTILKNRKGEAITIAVAGVAAVCILLGLLFRPIMDKVLPMFGNNQKIVSTKTTESKPVWEKAPDGTFILTQKTTTTCDNSAAPIPLTLWQKIQSLGMIGIGLVVLGVIFPPLGLVLAIVWKKITGGLKATIAAANTKITEVIDAHEELTGDAKKIVLSIDDGLATMDANIKAAKTMADSTLDANVKATYNTIAAALMDMKADFMAAMSKTQDSTTKLLVRELKND